MALALPGLRAMHGMAAVDDRNSSAFMEHLPAVLRFGLETAERMIVRDVTTKGITMLLHDKSYLSAIHELLEKADSACVAVAFWGEGSESIFKKWQGKSLRILCNLSMGGTNPSVIPKLQALQNMEIKQVDTLHAKLVMTNKAMVVGSANMSCNGLGLEDNEVDGFHELGLCTKNSALLERASVWFDDLWSEARPITQADLDAANEAWRRRRATRNPNKKNQTSLLELSPEDMKDREIYFVFFRDHVSDTALRHLKETNSALTQQSGVEHDVLDVYEGWKESELPKDPNAILIPVYWGKKGAIRIDAPQRPIPDLEKIYVKDGETIRLDFTTYVQNPETLEAPLEYPKKGNKDKKLCEWLKKWLQSMPDRVDKDGEVAFCEPVHAFLAWYRDNRAEE